MVPCDCLLLKGSAVLNEATLTGESVPQLKDAVVVDDDSRHELLDVQLKHKVHVLWGGTRILQHQGVVDETTFFYDKSNPSAEAPTPPENPRPPQGTPNGGSLCFVLRTGFQSSQGRVGSGYAGHLILSTQPDRFRPPTGRLVRTIQYASENVSSDTKETLLLVLLLLVFALTAR